MTAEVRDPDQAAAPDVGSLVEVRGQRWVTADVVTGPDRSSTLVSLQSVEDGRYGETLSVLWEVEPGRRILPTGSLPAVAPDTFDPPERLAAFLDAVRWSAVTSADVKTLQAPFRSGVTVEDYQLEPLARAVDAPRVNLLLADDVGLGKTIEAGLVAHELRLRHRVSSIMVVCPAGLTVKWRDEMAAKFGLSFTIIDATQCAVLRRSHGSAANPFRAYPLSIVSLPWLRAAKAQRLLDEVLPPDGPSYPRTFDLLILDEAHHVAPAAPRQAYAVDSQQTRLVRRLAPHFEHRLFLSATPHNGYPSSFTALLEILDDQRFARGVPPERAALRDVVVRRLKQDIVGVDGSRRFRERHNEPIPVEYSTDERRVHARVTEFARLRRQKFAQSRRGRRATDLVTLVLKKRLFSSPAAFAHTVGAYSETLRTRAGVAAQLRDDVPEWLDSFFEETAAYDDEQLAAAEDDALAQTTRLLPAATGQELELLDEMARWAQAYTALPDAKARELLTYLKAQCRPDGRYWLNERVLVFTEYRDTQRWLAQLLAQEGLGGDRLALLHGGITPDDREQLRLAFQADPSEHPVRILLATDAASEGIDLQAHCHRLVNYDIPFNPNKLEQRIGRIDRYGQRANPQVLHFVGVGWESADPYSADLEFLARVARKVGQMEADLGRVNAVLADKVQRRMLGEIADFDIESAGRATGRREENVPAETDVSNQVRRLRRELDETVRELALTPDRVRRVVDVALHLARQQQLRWVPDEKASSDELYEAPPLTGSWIRATDGLAEPLRRPGELPRMRPVTFSPEAARGRDDVVLAHLEHPLVALSTRLLRAAVWSPTTDLHRVAAVVSDHPALEEPLAAAFARYVLVGSDGVRLHEEVLYAGGWVREGGGFARVENLGVLDELLSDALSTGIDASGTVQRRLADDWPRVERGVVRALDWRAAARGESLARALDRRRDAEQRQVVDRLEQFGRSLRAALADEPESDQLELRFADGTRISDAREVAQVRRDRASWQARLDRLSADRERELDRVAARYAQRQSHLFPVAVVFVVPRRIAVG